MLLLFSPLLSYRRPRLCWLAVSPFSDSSTDSIHRYLSLARGPRAALETSTSLAGSRKKHRMFARQMEMRWGGRPRAEGGWRRVVRLGDGGRQSEQTGGRHNTNTGQLELCPCVGCGSPVAATALFGRAAMDAPIAEEGLFSGWQRLARREGVGKCTACRDRVRVFCRVVVFLFVLHRRIASTSQYVMEWWRRGRKRQ
ncbi:hypothetical protein B0T11DRAFT_145996 [Plectosphaerella cucumerina]|uniref:Uncharacterized protein n=1 Tax=Plectosphaerella cucumerina TaxID=40658 RepID=A0A8K0T683_9PEZI|nr:hypothetical protein B0T11DRAFT_145996 [Plectosphaerella cucumerina]